MGSQPLIGFFIGTLTLVFQTLVQHSQHASHEVLFSRLYLVSIVATLSRST